jgi:hypothetical protein
LSKAPRLSLPSVTLIAVTSVNVQATISAVRASMRQAQFGAVKLLTDKGDAPHAGIERIRIPPLRSATAYSHFMLHDLLEHVSTDFALVVQWDGFVINPAMWQDEFLSWDYIGAPWPQFRDGHDVGNGGFSLRSRRLLEACRDPGFEPSHPEDVAICRGNRRLLEENAIVHHCQASAFTAFSTWSRHSGRIGSGNSTLRSTSDAASAVTSSSWQGRSRGRTRSEESGCGCSGTLQARRSALPCADA